MAEKKKKKKGLWDRILDAIRDANDNDKSNPDLPLAIGILGGGAMSSGIGCDGGGGGC